MNIDLAMMAALVQGPVLEEKRDADMHTIFLKLQTSMIDILISSVSYLLFGGH